MWKDKGKGSKESGEIVGGEEFEAAAARVMVPEAPAVELPGASEGAALPLEKFEIPAEWAAFLAGVPFGVVAKFYHPAFAISEEQAQKLGPKLLPLIRKITDVWIPSWMAGAANRNPELLDAVVAFGVVAVMQWQAVQQIQRLEAEQKAREAAAREREAAADYFESHKAA